MNDEVIHIAVGLSDKTGNYTAFTLTMIVSVMLHTSRELCFHIIHDDTLKNKQIEEIKNTIAAFGQKYQFHLVKLDETYDDIKSVKALNIGTMLRLSIPSVIKEASKVIYLDSDIIVNRDICELWDVDISDYLFAGVIDTVHTRKKYIEQPYYRRIGYDSQFYVNAGVLVFNCERLKYIGNLLYKGIDFLRLHNKLAFADQDVINYFGLHKIKSLDSSFNLQLNLEANSFPGAALQKKAILHFSGQMKPWQNDDIDFIKYYGQYMMKIYRFSKSSDPIYEYLQILLTEKKKYFNLKRILLQIPRGSSRLHIFLLILKGILSDEKYKGFVKWLQDKRLDINLR